MNEDMNRQHGMIAKGELSIAEISAVAGPEFASWLCGLFGGEAPNEGAETGVAELV